MKYEKELINKLKTSNKELEQFAYVASHDLQEPLRMVASFSQLLERRYKDQIDEDADDYIEFIVEGANRMKKLIDDLLAFSRLNTEAKEFKLTDTNSALDDVLVNLNPTIMENNAQITHDPLPIIKVDSSQIRQLFQNLITNAIKFHGDEPPKIHISAEETGKEWLFSVSDNGIGIDSNHLEKIFNVFNRLHTREEYEGTGIGLAICKRIVERHGGKIWVESEPGKGSTFYFTLSKT
jgi:light-regulated signal transduction histidine kinase (bacteriophytochrome)